MEGQLLADVPSSVTLTFGEELLDAGAALVVTGPQDKVVSAAMPTIDKASISSEIAPGSPDGTYTVAYRVVSQDGHTVKGRFEFAVGPAPADATVEATPAAPATTAPTATATALPATQSPTAEAPTAEAPTAEAPAPESSGTPVMIVFLGLAAGIVVVMVVVSAVRRLR